MFHHIKFAIYAFFVVSTVGLISSCGGDDSAKDEIHDKNADNISPDQIKFIKIDDATTFLPSWSKDNVLVYHTVGEPDELHPTNGINASRSEILGYTQVYLVTTDFRTLTMRPMAVKALPTVSENEKEYTYELRKDIKFDDGAH